MIVLLNIIGATALVVAAILLGIVWWCLTQEDDYKRGSHE